MNAVDVDMVNRFDPTAPVAKQSPWQRRFAATLLTVGAALVAYGLSLDWISLSIDTSLGFDLGLEETGDSVWDAIPSSGYLLAAGAAFALAAAIVATVASRASASEQLAALTDLLAVIAGISVGVGLLITYFRWSDWNSKFDLDLGLPIAVNLQVGDGIWFAVGGAVLIGAGLTLHLARVKPAKSQAVESPVS